MKGTHPSRPHDTVHIAVCAGDMISIRHRVIGSRIVAASAGGGCDERGMGEWSGWWWWMFMAVPLR